ncbi:MAG TPA: serine hydrolase [Rhizomicrobium sp.]|nr:serine hydrolase [Rhizomicrobium sp.]
MSLDAEAADDLQSYNSEADGLLQPYIVANAFTGTVLVAKDGGVIFEKAYGLANREWGVPDTLDTKYRIGSMTKQFTATAILQLAEQGKLSIDDPVSKYYTNAPASWRKITIRNLLTHTSGIPDFTNLPDYEKFMPDDTTPLEIIERIRNKPLDFPPGTKFAYDNTGYVVLGYVIEEVSGESYADYIQQHIFAPLEMKDSGYDKPDPIIRKRAAGYYWRKGQWHRPPYISMTVPFAAGGLYSTVGDLLIWDQALYSGKLLSAASLKEMFTPYKSDYGFGWVIAKFSGHNSIWHNGEVNGFHSMILRFPNEHLTVIALSNDQLAAVERMSSDLAGLYFYDTGVKTPEAKLSSAALDAYVGQYKPAKGPLLTVARDGDGLTVAGANPPHRMYAISDVRFTLRTLPIEVRFTRDANGKIAALTIESDGQSTSAARVQ